MYRNTVCGHCAMEFLQCTATLSVGRGQPNSCNLLPHCLRAMAMEPVQCTTTFLVGSGQLNS